MVHAPRPLVLLSLLAALLVGGLTTAVASAADADGPPWRWPLEGRTVGSDFDAPDTPYGPGHRGVDLPGVAGEPVRAVAPGRVTFSGEVAGVGVVTVDHGTERSTYQPVEARAVRRGDAVDAGQVLGRLGPAGSHCVGACLHLGRLVGEEYLDPAERLGTEARFVLVDPDDDLPTPPEGSFGSFARPVAGPVTSAFGMRVHPVTGQRKLHDGVDVAAPCGTPVGAARAGTVRSVGDDGGYGLRVVVDHPGGTSTAYAHLSSTAVSPGARVDERDVLGRVGSTGLSTGCHLHFMVVVDGRPIDPFGDTPDPRA